jgi:hypothetical protein
MHARSTPTAGSGAGGTTTLASLATDRSVVQLAFMMEPWGPVVRSLPKCFFRAHPSQRGLGLLTMEPTDGGTAVTWGCFKPPSGSCPAKIPNAGEMCRLSDSAGTCEYGSGCNKYAMECKRYGSSSSATPFGTWEVAGQTACD